jgi:hypothetical protein
LLVNQLRFGDSPKAAMGEAECQASGKACRMIISQRAGSSTRPFGEGMGLIKQAPGVQIAGCPVKQVSSVSWVGAEAFGVIGGQDGMRQKSLRGLPAIGLLWVCWKGAAQGVQSVEGPAALFPQLGDVASHNELD